MSSLVYVKRLRHHRWTVLCIATGFWFNSWPLSGLCSLAVSHHLLSSCCQTMSYSLLLSIIFYYCMFHPDVLQPPGAVGPWYARFAFLQVQRNLWSKDGGFFMKIEETVSFQSFHLFGGEEGEARYWWGISCNYSACMFFFVSFLPAPNPHKCNSWQNKIITQEEHWTAVRSSSGNSSSGCFAWAARSQGPTIFFCAVAAMRCCFRDFNISDTQSSIANHK